jgi:transposase
MLSVPSTQTPALAFAGIDWGHKEHAVSVLDAHGKRHQKRFRHSADGCLGLRRWLTSFTADPASLLVAIERPDHPLAELLAEAGVGVYNINPRQVDRLRDRHWVSGAKDDEPDAILLADALRGDLPLFRRVVPADDLHLLLRETARRLRRLNRELLSLANRLGAVLRETAPEFLDLCGGANEPFFWDLAELATDDRIARRLRQSQVQKVLSRHRIRRLGAEAVLTALRTPRLWCSAGRRQADLDEVACLVPPPAGDT